MEFIAPRFCPHCGTAIGQPAEGDQPSCPSCEFVWYRDPKVAAGVLVSRAIGSGDGVELLLVRRNHAPAFGRWAFPSGFVDAGEVVECAALREVFEETGVTAGLDGLIGVYSESGNAVVFVAYAGTHVSGVAVAGDEAFEVSWFGADMLPELAFPHDAQIVADWTAMHRARG
jgi:8-oxo-dGTP diphosphatase